MTITKNRVRTKTPKVRTGCLTCKARRIKCDEAKPACSRCTGTGRICGGYDFEREKSSTALCPDGMRILPAPGQVQIVAGAGCHLASALRTLPAHLTTDQRHAFEYFYQQTGPQLAGTFLHGLWERLVLQAGHKEPVILHAIVAVGSMHRAHAKHFGSSPAVMKSSEAYRLGVVQHSKALVELQTFINASARKTSSIEIVLMACLLFVCFEMLQSEQATALAHLRRGLGILYESLQPQLSKLKNAIRTIDLSAEDKSPIETLLRCFVHLDTHSALIGVPQPYLTPGLTHKMQERLDSGKPFSSSQEAKVYLDVLVSEVLRERGHLQRLAREQLEPTLVSYTDWATRYAIIHASSRTVKLDSDPGFDTRHQVLLRNLDSWSSALSAMHDEGSTVAKSMLRLEFYPFWACSKLLRSTRECNVDSWQPMCVHIVELAERQFNRMSIASITNTFALEPVILPALYAVGLKCYDSRIRRRAINLLQNATFQEGLWNGKVLSQFLERVADLQEAKARKLKPDLAPEQHLGSTDMPEEARFVDIVNAMDGPSTARMVCARFAHEHEGEIVLEEYIVEMAPAGTTDDTDFKEDEVLDEDTELFGKRCFASTGVSSQKAGTPPRDTGRQQKVTTYGLPTAS